MIKEQQIKIFEHLVKVISALISTARKISKIDVEYSVQTITNWDLRLFLVKIVNQMNQFSGSDHVGRPTTNDRPKKEKPYYVLRRIWNR